MEWKIEAPIPGTVGVTAAVWPWALALSPYTVPPICQVISKLYCEHAQKSIYSRQCRTAVGGVDTATVMKAGEGRGRRQEDSSVPGQLGPSHVWRVIICSRLLVE